MNIILTKNNWRFILDLLGEKYEFQYDRESHYEDLEWSFGKQNEEINSVYYVTLNSDNKIVLFARFISGENQNIVDDLINFEYGSM